MLTLRTRIAATLAAALMVAAAGAGMAGANGPSALPEAGGSTGAGGVGSGGGAAGADTGGAPATYKSFTVKGGYTAAGVGLRNRGSGTIELNGLPSGAKVKAAYLYWAILGGDTAGSSFKKGKINGHSFSGSLIGSGPAPCWDGSTKGYSYRKDVTKWVKRNGKFALSGFASAVRNGRDPFVDASTRVSPMAEGASLVVVYTKSRYPETRVVLADGYAEVQGSPGATVTIPFGFTASNPVGQVTTTFIGADGQSNFDKPASLFNGVPMAAVQWNGKDRATGNYSYGNLWDTQTVPVIDLVKPGNTSATVTVQGGPDCIAWVAQVLSIGKNGALDTDGDKLLDGWEANGYDATGDFRADINLPAMGANPLHKDLFVEMDYMGAETTCPCHLPLASDLDRIVAVYAGAPQANNPDGKTGINLHLDAGTARGSKYNLGGGNLVPYDADLNPVVSQFYAIKSANFDIKRAPIFYYMIWAHGYDGGSSSGIAMDIPTDSFVVTLGRWPGGGSSDAKVGTFVHEFGHALGQKHGGNDHSNYKPNYLSVMNYAFQTIGVQRTGTTAPYFGYSSTTLPSLKETALNEKKGLRSSYAKTYRDIWYCAGIGLVIAPGRSDRNLDWNCNNKMSSSVSSDINGDGQKTTLKGFNNWGSIVYGGGDVGDIVSPLGLGDRAGQRARITSSNQPIPDALRHELTFEEAQRMQLRPPR